MLSRGFLAGSMVFAMAVPGLAYDPPTETGESGLITVPTTSTISPGMVSVGAYVRRDIESQVTFEPELGATRDTDVVQAEFSAGVGIIDGLELTASVPYVSLQFDRPGELTDTRAVGNVRVTPKYRFLTEGVNGMPLSVALMGSAHIPTGDEDFSNPIDRNSVYRDEFSGEVMAIVDKKLFTLPGDADSILTINVGGLFLGDDSFDRNIQTQPVFEQLRRKGITNPSITKEVVQFGAGWNLPLWKDWAGQFDATAEFRGNTGVIDDIDEYRQVLAGFRYRVWNGLALSGGVDFGLSNSVDRYAGTAGVSYTGPQPARGSATAGTSKVRYKDRIIEVEKVAFTDVNFDFDKATLTDLGRGRVYLIAQKLKEGKNLQIEVQGHTDYIGTDDYNKSLGLKRAETVKAELLRLGVDATRISTVSFGEAKPLIDKETPWARAVNRRAEFVVVGEPDKSASAPGRSSETEEDEEPAPAEETEE